MSKRTRRRGAPQRSDWQLRPYRVAPPAVSVWVERVNARLDELEAHWGAARLVSLVGPELAARWLTHWDRWCCAVHLPDGEHDVDAVAVLSRGCLRGLDQLDAEARRLGAVPVAEVDPDRFEIELEDGRVLVVVRTMRDGLAIDDGRNVVVWSMDELARVLPMLTEIQAVKGAFPGAQVVKVDKLKAPPDADFDDAMPF